MNNFHQLPSRMKDANAVRETRVTGAWKHEVRETELLNATQALERAGLDDPPKNALEFVVAFELN